MIYFYEAAILEFINGIFPDVKEATYSIDEDMFIAMGPFRKYPSFYYFREDPVFEDNRIIVINEPGNSVGFNPAFEQKYKGIIIHENQRVVFDMASKLRFKWNSKPYVTINWPTPQNTLKVQLRLLYIKVGEIRQPDDKKGPCKTLEFGWQSNLFYSQNLTGDAGTYNPENPDAFVYPSSYGDVEKVNIYLDTEGRGVAVGTDEQGNEIILNSYYTSIYG